MTFRLLKGKRKQTSILFLLYKKFAKAYSNREIARELRGDMKGDCSDWRKASSLGLEGAAKWGRDQCE